MNNEFEDNIKKSDDDIVISDVSNSGQLKIDLFKGKEIRKVWHQNEWWFSVIDIIGVLTDSNRPRQYWSDLKKRLVVEGLTQLSEKIVQLKMPANDGKLRDTDVATTETMLRIIQSIPSPKAEPFKRWIARVGFERIAEINDPSLAIKRARATYIAKGYPDDWIDIRVQGIQKREELTDEWKSRGVQDNDYAILTAEISKATFGITPSEHKQVKGIKQHNSLRDNMTPLELVFTMLGDVSTKEIASTQDAQGFEENKIAAKEGGSIAGNARKELEKKTGKKVVSRNNYRSIAQRNSPKALPNNSKGNDDK
jgi:DNA-damage-inducible protein D